MPFNARQYEIGEPFFGPADGNVIAEMDQKRLRAYDLYENLYWNNHTSLKIVLRGEDSLPIYMPSGKKIIEATNRFLGQGFDYFVESGSVDNPDEPPDEGSRQTIETYFGKWFKREELRSKFASNKRWGLVRADAVFYITADPNKEEGSRLSIHELDPRQLFLIDDPKDTTRVTGCYIVETVPDFREPDTDKKIVKRTAFRKTQDDDGNFTGKVTSEVTHWTVGKWDDRVLKPEDMEQVRNPEEDKESEDLPDPISQLPIYKWRNSPPQNSSWGMSQLVGLETLIFGINQSLSDEDLTLVMQGLGMYKTNAAPPQDPNNPGVVQDWNVGPGQVVEVGQDQYFDRVTGVSDVSPYQNHMTFMDEKGLSESSGTPAIAIGRVDVAVAESGISLKLQLMPLLAQNAEKELEFIQILDQMFHDIVNMWLPAYENIQPNGVIVSCIFDDPMPVNRDARVQETLLLYTSDLILLTMAIDSLTELGWKYPQQDADGNPLDTEAIAAMLLAQASSKATAADPFSAQGLEEDTSAQEQPLGAPENNGQPTTVDLGVT
jgi:hypothetical protein